MRAIALLLFICMLNVSKTFSQSPTSELSSIERAPQFPGGFDSLARFLSQNIKYPKDAYKKGIAGRVLVGFTIQTDGSLADIHVSKKLSDELDAEALRVITMLPNWIPGIQNSKPVAVKFVIPISFTPPSAPR